MNFCPHTLKINNSITPRTPNGCEECLLSGDSWVQLRMCMSCGHVGCCDSSKNRHATKHYAATKHPIIKSLKTGENWKWCFIDKTYI